MFLRVTLIAVLIATGVAHAEQPVSTVKIGEKVTDFSVKALDGTTWKLSDLRDVEQLSDDGVTVLTFWCSFCHSCRHVEGPLDKLAKKYKGKVLVMAVDSSVGETANAVAAFKKKKRLSLPIGLDPNGQAADVFGARFTTTTAVIDRDGVLRYLGQFGHGDDRFAEDALKDVLAGRDVQVNHSQQRG